MAGRGASAGNASLPIVPVVVPGLVTVVIVNYRGADDTAACLRSLADLDWPMHLLEVICVDNDSADGSEERLRAEFPQVRVFGSGANLGFAGACNLAARMAAGEYLALLNNDARPDPGWLRYAVSEFDADPRIASVASRVLDWNGQLVDYADAAMTWYGMGYKPGAGEAPSQEADQPRDVLFGTGSAVLFRSEIFRDVGGFDERYFMFFEDVDLGWRLNVFGYRVRYAPASVAYHRHHATMSRYGRFREDYLLERNALLTLYKNYDDESLTRCLAPAMALAVRRAVAQSGIDTRQLDLQHSPGGDEHDTVELPKAALTAMLAIDYFVEHLAEVDVDRRRIQARRRREDSQILPLFRNPLEPALHDADYERAHWDLSEAFGLADYFARRRRILVVTGEPLTSRMAGPAIRAFEMSRLLAAEHDVTLVSTSHCEVEGDGFQTVRAGRGLRKLVARSDLIVFQGLLLSSHPWVADASGVLVADIYDPFHLEILEQQRHRPNADRDSGSQATVSALNLQLGRADFFLCASEKQRDFWLGQLAGQGRVNPATYDDDESLRSLIDVAPFGIPESAPVQGRHGIRGVIPGIGPHDRVVLWGGGVYNWFDPLTLIAAIDRVRAEIPTVRLVFLGMKHPNPGVPEMEMSARARALSDHLGLTGVHVFFNEEWVPYDERADFLLDADVGVSCHLDHVETEFSFRTRILDYLWAGLPIVCTDGDSFADLVRSERLGYTVPAEDVESLATTLAHVLRNDSERHEISQRVRTVAAQFTWRRTLEPLMRVARNPRRAPDLTGLRGAASLSRPQATPPPRGFAVKEDLALARVYLRQGGVAELASRVGGRVRRLTRKRPGS